MENQDFTMILLLDRAPEKVFNAINNVRGWWSENVEGDTDKLGSEFSYHYQDVHCSWMKITELIPNERVVWHVLDNYFKFTKDEREWAGTDVVFEITEKAGNAQLKFTHVGLVPDYECYQICRDAWTHYIQDSLKNLILTGKGKPIPKETEDGNAEMQTEEIQGEPTKPTTKGICHRLLIETPVENVYGALTTQEGLAGWWTPETVAAPVVGSIARFGFGPDHFTEVEINELKPYSRVKWLCVKAQEEWIGTTLTFELEPHAKGAVLFFHHDGWNTYTPQFAGASYAWALFLRSLKFFCEAGKGFPYPDFNK